MQKGSKCAGWLGGAGEARSSRSHARSSAPPLSKEAIQVPEVGGSHVTMQGMAPSQAPLCGERDTPSSWSCLMAAACSCASACTKHIQG